MTREEEIIQAADECYPTWEEHNAGFYQGAEWADQHPREGLWDRGKIFGLLHEIINSDTIAQYLIFDDENIDFDSELFFEDLQKAMED